MATDTMTADLPEPDPVYGAPDKIRAVLVLLLGVGLIAMSVDILTGGALTGSLRRSAGDVPAE